jgi:hypothetical protein
VEQEVGGSSPPSCTNTFNDLSFQHGARRALVAGSYWRGHQRSAPSGYPPGYPPGLGGRKTPHGLQLNYGCHKCSGWPQSCCPLANPNIKFSSPDHRIAPHGQIGLGGSLVVDDLIKRFKKAVDEFSESPLFSKSPLSFNLEGDFEFPSLVRYQFAGPPKTTELVGVEETHVFHIYGQANVPHLEHVAITASFNEYGPSPPAESKKQTMVGKGVLTPRGFEFAIRVPAIVAKNSLELMRSVQHRVGSAADPKKAYLRIAFYLDNIKTNHEGRTIFDVSGMRIYDDDHGGRPLY